MVQDFSKLNGQNDDGESVDFGALLQAVVDGAVAKAKEEQRKFIEEENIPENPGRQLAFSEEEDRIIYEFFPKLHAALIALEDAVAEADTAIYEAIAEATEEDYPDGAFAPISKLYAGFKSIAYFQACLGTQEQFDRQLSARQRVIEFEDKKHGTNYLEQFFEGNPKEIEFWNNARQKRNFTD